MTNRSLDEKFMRLALDEAAKALGRTHPNPAVGAVIVKGGRVIATGFHEKAGQPHAEAIALTKAGRAAKGATLYVTLEPCNHHGRTPPCSEAVIAAGIKRVVYGAKDPNPLVNGKGARRLRSAGLDVRGGVLAEVCDELNLPFNKAVTTGLPWVTLKAGITLDGKLASASGDSKWITSDPARIEAHRLRDRVDAVLVGAGTVRRDDPLLTTRLPKGRTPVRVVLDSRLSLSPSSQVFDSKAGRVVVATLADAASPRARALVRRGVELWQFEAERTQGLVPLEPLLRRLVQADLLHVLVEGGATIHSRFIASRLADEVVLFVAPKLLGHEGLSWSGALGLASMRDAVDLTPVSIGTAGPDAVLRARFRWVNAPRASSPAAAKRR